MKGAEPPGGAGVMPLRAGDVEVEELLAFGEEPSRIGAERCQELQDLVRRQLELLGEDAERVGLARTPYRVSRALAWLTRGCDQHVQDVVGDAVFDESHESMVMVRDIELYSLCEHHLLPFFGKAHVAYLPNGKILGLSKVARIVDLFARRLQVQERLTAQISEALMRAVEPMGAAVIIEAYHLCMMMRGVGKQNSKTVTSSMLGEFRANSTTRKELLHLLNGLSLSAP